MSCMDLEQTIQSIKEMDQKDLEEALPRLLEEALKADKALRAAQKRLREASGKRAKCPSFVEVHGDHLLVNRKTRNKNLNAWCEF